MSSYAECIEQILIKIADYTKLSIKEKYEDNIFAFFASVSLSNGQRFYVGTSAFNDLRQLALRGLNNSDYRNRLDLEDVTQVLIKLVAEWFIFGDRDLSASSGGEVVKAAIEAVAQNAQEITHFVPIYLGSKEGPSIIRFGEYELVKIDVFFEEIRNFTDAFGEAHGYEKYNIEMIDDIKVYYKTFDRVVKIKIDPCSSSISASRATKISADITNCLNVFFGMKHSKNMRSGGPRVQIDKRGFLRADANNNLLPEWSVDWMGSHLGKGWAEHLSEGISGDLIKSMGLAVQNGNNIDQSSEFSQRFLDAAAWYGEASRDRFAASSIVKYVTALERLVITKKTRGELKKIFAQRSAAFCFASVGGDLDCHAIKFAALYKLRSDMVHGAVTPFDQYVRSQVSVAAELSREVILMYVAIARESAFSLGKRPDRRLEEWLLDVEKYSAEIFNLNKSKI